MSEIISIVIVIVMNSIVLEIIVTTYAFVPHWQFQTNRDVSVRRLVGCGMDDVVFTTVVRMCAVCYD